jgi:hypothetical protein
MLATILVAVLRLNPVIVLVVALLTIFTMVNFVLEFTRVRRMSFQAQAAVNIVAFALVAVACWRPLSNAVYPLYATVNVWQVSKWFNGDATIVVVKIAVFNPGPATSLGNFMVTATVNGKRVAAVQAVINNPVFPCESGRLYLNSSTESADVSRNIAEHSMTMYYLLRKVDGVQPDAVDGNTVQVTYLDIITNKTHDAVISKTPIDGCTVVPGLGVWHNS